MWLGFPVGLEQMHKERAVLVNPEFDRRRMAVGAVSKRIAELLYDARGVSGLKSKGKAHLLLLQLLTTMNFTGLSKPRCWMFRCS